MGYFDSRMQNNHEGRSSEYLILKEEDENLLAYN
jgi:hypothetical protein